MVYNFVFNLIGKFYIKRQTKYNHMLFYFLTVYHKLPEHRYRYTQNVFFLKGLITTIS